MRIFLDANMLFSAAKSDGAIRQLLKLLRESRHILVADSFVVEEARRNLARKADPSGSTALDALLSVIEVGSVTHHPSGAEWLDWLPAKDRPVLASAAGQGCAVLMTGDRAHFGSGYGKRFNGVRILSPSMAADEFLA
jgi:predicted nucleic acid-binding protein